MSRCEERRDDLNFQCFCVRSSKGLFRPFELVKGSVLLFKLIFKRPRFRNPQVRAAKVWLLSASHREEAPFARGNAATLSAVNAISSGQYTVLSPWHEHLYS